MVKKVKTGQIDVNIFDECFHETEGKRRDDKKVKMKSNRGSKKSFVLKCWEMTEILNKKKQNLEIIHGENLLQIFICNFFNNFESIMSIATKAFIWSKEPSQKKFNFLLYFKFANHGLFFNKQLLQEIGETFRDIKLVSSE